MDDDTMTAAEDTHTITVEVEALAGEKQKVRGPVVNACLWLFESDGAGVPLKPGWIEQKTWDDLGLHRPLRVEHSNQQGLARFQGLPSGRYVLLYHNVTPFKPYHVLCQHITLRGGSHSTRFTLDPDIAIHNRFFSGGVPHDREHALVGDTLWTTVQYPVSQPLPGDQTNPPTGFRYVPEQPLQPQDGGGSEFSAKLAAAGKLHARVAVRMRSNSSGASTEDHSDFAYFMLSEALTVDDAPAVPVRGEVVTHAARTETEFLPDIAHWMAIKNSTEAMSFNNYKLFIDQLFCKEPKDPHGPFTEANAAFQSLQKRRFLPFTDTDAYRVLKAATEAFVMVNCGVLHDPHFSPREDADYLDRRDLPNDENLRDALLNRYLTSLDATHRTLPYLALIRAKLPDVPIRFDDQQQHEADLCLGIIGDRLTNPCMLELIWSYWHDEGALAATMNAIMRRFQNARMPGRNNGPDPLAGMEMDGVRGARAFLWGMIQDEQHRLSTVRRNYEYDHQYGIRLDGAAVRNVQAADSRSRFIEAFHHLLRQLMTFYRQDDDTTVKADAFPVLNALKEVHLLLSQGAHNQYGEMPSTARVEMMMTQWILARPEFREYLPTRLMVAYPEPWMDRVDAMKKLQGWGDTSVLHFRDLAIFGEQMLSAIRSGKWSDESEPNKAFAFARFWRPPAQGYMHAYRAVTGCDLTSKIADPQLEAAMPSVLLSKRLAAEQRRA